jgi:amidase
MRTYITAIILAAALGAASASSASAQPKQNTLARQDLLITVTGTPLKPVVEAFKHGALDVMPGVMAAQAEMRRGTTTSEALVKRYLGRTKLVDKTFELHAIIVLNPHALDDARRLDAERKAGHVRGPLHGVPILLKDNIESDDDTATTAGSLALRDNVSHRDAPLVKRLKDAGAVILGKTNLSEWANSRSTQSVSGWSGVGGLVRNPYALDRSACGSSSGSGAAVAASLASAAVGTETDGSVTCPSSVQGLVGLKPTVGLVSRTHVIPISHSQDTAGPMGRSVEDVAALLTAMAGSDPEDPATMDADRHRTDYLRALAPDALTGRRIGVVRDDLARATTISPLYAAALARLRAAGAVLVEIGLPKVQVEFDEDVVLGTELKADLNAYLASTPRTVTARTLADLIAFDKASPREMSLFAQETFERAQASKGLDDPTYREARRRSMTKARAAIDDALARDKLDAIVMPTVGPAWRVDVVDGDHYSGNSTTLPAVAGYPHLTVPMGRVRGLPVGLSFWGPQWSEARLLAFGFAYQEQGARFVPPNFRLSVEAAPEVEAAFSPSR